MSGPSLPLVDISPFLPSASFNHKARKACAVKIFNSCASTGFFYLVNHGITQSQTDAILSLGREFLLNSSMDEKNAIARKKVGVGDGDGVRGWQPIRDNVTGGKRDWQEAIDFYREDTSSMKDPPYKILQGKNIWPQNPAELKETYQTYIESMLGLGEVLMAAMGTALGHGSEDFFVEHTKESFWGMRLIGYAPIPESDQIPEGTSDNGISCGEHTDYGCITFLLQDHVKGALQVKSTSGEWINADPIPGTFVVNIGDMMERWTNGLWQSTIHRVVHRGEEFRVSLPFFYEPNFDTIVKPLQACIAQTGGLARYSEVTYGEHLLSKVSNNFYTGVRSVESCGAESKARHEDESYLHLPKQKKFETIVSSTI